jgi:hypothetical protein
LKFKAGDGLFIYSPQFMIVPHTHDPREFVRGLQQILISGTKRIGFFAGAGTSMIKEKPNGKAGDGSEFSSLVLGTKEMTENIVASISELADKSFQKAIDAIKDELVTEGSKFHIENLISKITQKELVVGNEKLCGLDRSQLKQLKELLEAKIRVIVSIHKADNFSSWEITHYKFAEWIAEANRKNCVEVFTTNYDYLFEIAFERNGMPYFDGFIGSFTPSFHSYSVEDDYLLSTWTKLWKIHGSLGWDYDDKDKKFIRVNKDSDKIVVYPSLSKYDKSKKQPYVSFIDRLNRFVKREDTVLFITGYSFSDEHVNETILNALSRSKTSSAIAFVYDSFDENSSITKLAMEEPRLSVYGKRHAVIGKKFGAWQLRSQPSIDDDIQISNYFLQDAPSPKSEKGKGDEVNLMNGDFILVDFIKLVTFLSDLNYSNYRIPKK